MGRQTAEEIRKEVLANDDTKDVSIYMSVPIGVIAGLSAVGAVCAVVVMRAMVYFRSGIDAYWLSCVPFLFPVISGLFAAYKKQFSLLGVHMAVNLMALLMGGFGFALSIEPVFLRRDECVPVTPSVACNKTSLAYLYVVTGGVAAGFAVLGFLLTLCALNSANNRMAKRRREEEIAHLRDVEQQQRDQRQMKMTHDAKPRTFSATSPVKSSANTVTNGAPQVPPQTNPTATENKSADASDVTTKL